MQYPTKRLIVIFKAKILALILVVQEMGTETTRNLEQAKTDRS